MKWSWNLRRRPCNYNRQLTTCANKKPRLRLPSVLSNRQSRSLSKRACSWVWKLPVALSYCAHWYSETTLDKTKDTLSVTQEELRVTKQTLEETRAELKQTIKTYDADIKILEQELFEETSWREKLLKIKAELEKEIQMLRWYFKPLGTQIFCQNVVCIQLIPFSFLHYRETRKRGKTSRLAHSRVQLCRGRSSTNSGWTSADGGEWCWKKNQKQIYYGKEAYWY